MMILMLVQKLVGRASLIARGGETFEGEWLYEKDEHGATQVFFIFSSGEKAGEKYLIGLDDLYIHIANDAFVVSDKILEV